MALSSNSCINQIVGKIRRFFESWYIRASMARNSRFTPDRAVLLGVLATAALYLRDLRYDFILDDVPLILMNQTIASWRNWKMLFTHHIFYSPDPQVPVQFTVHYRPVYMLWLTLNQALFGAVVPWW